ncbi:MAG TPA: ThuA domain-containing protein, partial [Spirochaetia bacterium]
MQSPLRVTVWNENRHEKNDPAVTAIYPRGIHGAIAAFLAAQTGIAARTATLDEPANGLPPAVLDATDVLVWWGHMAHAEVSDDVAARVQARVLAGMGLIVLHSGHLSKPFVRLMG